MAADIGANIGIDGEKAFRDSLSAINSQMKALGSEMKAVVAGFAGMEDSEEAVSAKTDVLGRSIETSTQKLDLLQKQSDRAKSKLATLADELENAKREFGENSAEAIKAQNAYNRQVTTANKLETQINQTRAEISKMEREMRDAGDAADRMGDDLEQAARDADDAGNSFRDAFVGGAVSGAVQALASGMAQLVEETTEYRKIMGTLAASGEASGYTAEQTAETYKQLYGVLGDSQTAATAAANLQALGLEQKKLTKLTEGAIGAWAKYGDSIPIDGLAESINETIKTGAVTGSFADVLNWGGTSEDDFNAKLEVSATSAERLDLVLQELSDQGLYNLADGYRTANEELVKANEANAKMEEVTGRIGTMLSPIVASLKSGLATILGHVVDLVEQGSPLIALATGLSVAIAGLGLATFITQAGSVVTVITKMKDAFMLLNTTMKANPILLVVSLLAGLVAALVTAYQTNEEFRVKVDEIWTLLKESVGTAVTVLKGYVDSLKEKFAFFVEYLSALPKKMKAIGVDIVKGIWEGIQSKVEWLKSKVKSLVDMVKKMFTGGDGFDTHSPSKWSKGVAGDVIDGYAIEFKRNTGAADAAGNVVDSIKAKMQKSMQNMADSMTMVTRTPALAMAGNASNYAYGDIVLNIGTVNNANGRDVQTIAQELEFYRRQQTTGRGGGY